MSRYVIFNSKLISIQYFLTKKKIITGSKIKITRVLALVLSRLQEPRAQVVVCRSRSLLIHVRHARLLLDVTRKMEKKKKPERPSSLHTYCRKFEQPLTPPHSFFFSIFQFNVKTLPLPFIFHHLFFPPIVHLESAHTIHNTSSNAR